MLIVESSEKKNKNTKNSIISYNFTSVSGVFCVCVVFFSYPIKFTLWWGFFLYTVNFNTLRQTKLVLYFNMALSLSSHNSLS